MHILHISNMYPSQKFPYYGTFVHQIHLFLERIARVDLVTIDQKKDTRFGKVYLYFIFYLKIITTMLKRKWDIIYLHYPSHTYVPLILFCPLIRSRIVINFHGGDAFTQPSRSSLFFKIKKIVNQRAIDRADLVVVPSFAFAKALAKSYRVDEDYILVNYSGGVDIDFFKTFVSRPSPKANKRILYAARMHPVKDPFYLVDFLKKHSRFLDVFDLTMVGSGELENEVRASVQNLAVKIFGAKSQIDLKDTFCKNDFLIQTSIQESLGLVVLEAMSCECIPICRSIPVYEEIIDHGVNGFVFYDEDGLYKCLEKISTMSEYELSYIKHNARKKIEDNYSRKVSQDLTINGILQLFKD